ncbi:MAG: NF038122 family metalloprotease [Fibrella sp.]|nr:NF038122 family metalloprotease [Armatimonadota bacterium]
MVSRRNLRSVWLTLTGTLTGLVWGVTQAYACGLCDDPQHFISGHLATPTSTATTDIAEPGYNLGSFNIIIRPNATLSNDAAALAAFERAATNWERYISDPITVTIDAGFESLGGGILGSTRPRAFAYNYDFLRGQVVTDATDEGANDTVATRVPTSAQFSNALLPSGFSLSGGLAGTKANLKALGITDLDETQGDSDGIINFSTNFAFDYDNTDNMNTNLTDFETVATHEIGHLLGFISAVDTVDTSASGSISPYTLDLFRFADNVAGSDPGSLPQFMTNARSLLTGVEAITDDVDSEFRMSTGRNKGDGRQASHWKDGDLTAGNVIGVMDPTLAAGQVVEISAADLRAFDLIGYDINYQPVPAPPAAISLGIGGLVGLLGVGARKLRTRLRRDKKK